MARLTGRFLPALCAALLSIASPAPAVRPEAPMREVAPVPREFAAGVDAGRLDPEAPLGRGILVLRHRDPEGLARLLAAQQDPSSPDYRRWLAPEEFAARFGASDADVAALRAWLEGHGLAVEVARGRSAIVFSGRAGEVERAFGTELHEVQLNAAVHVANVAPARLPEALAARTAGLALDNLRRRRPLARRSPAYTVGGAHYLAPADVWALYGMDALLGAGTTGAGRSIAVAGDSNVRIEDTRYFRTYFGLPANDPQVVVNGPDPGLGPNENEADIDVQWAGAAAPGARVTLVTSRDTALSYGVDLSVLYAVDHDLADALSLSFGACEADFGDFDTTFYTNIWAQAAAQGITAVVAAGDSGATGCDPLGSNAGVLSVNGLGSSPYATAVGGTQFLDDSSASWNATNDPVTKKSVKGPIAETTWNQGGTLATGGGVSVLFPRPPWQSVAGVPAGSTRVVPDVSLNASTRNAYAIVRGHTSTVPGFEYYGGTSVGAPVVAGVAALLAQREGTRIGNLNPLLYAAGAAQYGTISSPGTGSGPFRDVTTGTNAVGGKGGYGAGSGYDAATGLGSFDTTALLAALPPPSVAGADLALVATPGVLSVASGGAGTVALTLSQASGAADAVATVSVSGLPAGLAASFSPSTMNDERIGIVSRAEAARLTLSAGSGTAPGTYRLDLSAAAGGATRRVSIFVTVGAVAAVPPPGPGLQAPVILDVYGAASSHYTSDFVAVNRGTADATLLLRFARTPAPTPPGPVIARSLPAGRELYVPDVIAFLNANGYSLPADGSSKIGTLFATFVGASDPLAVFVGSRTATPNPNPTVGGAFGTFSAGVPLGAAPAAEAWIYGLRENASFRSNLALVHAPGDANGTSAGPVTLEVQLYDGDGGAPVGAPLGCKGVPGSCTLQPGEFFQFNRVLTLAPVGIANGYARVRLTAGTDRFIAYGVVNDGSAAGGGTSDGSFLPANATEGLLPIVLDLPAAVHYTSDLTLTNPTAAPVNVSLTYTASSAFSGAGSGTVTVPLAARRQLLVPNAVAYLRSLGLPIPADGGQGGTLLVAGAPALARTSNPNPDAGVGGTFGLAYPAVGGTARATTEAWVHGLRQDADARTNLAIADARAGNAAGVEYVVDVFDADAASTSPAITKRVTLAGGQWTQFNTILAEAGLVHGYARVRPSAGTSDFVVYGVVNDGPAAGSRTSDGSYVPMVVVN